MVPCTRTRTLPRPATKSGTAGSTVFKNPSCSICQCVVVDPISTASPTWRTPLISSRAPRSITADAARPAFMRLTRSMPPACSSASGHRLFSSHSASIVDGRNRRNGAMRFRDAAMAATVAMSGSANPGCAGRRSELRHPFRLRRNELVGVYFVWTWFHGNLECRGDRVDAALQPRRIHVTDSVFFHVRTLERHVDHQIEPVNLDRDIEQRIALLQRFDRLHLVGQHGLHPAQSRPNEFPDDLGLVLREVSADDERAAEQVDAIIDKIEDRQLVLTDAELLEVK